MHDLAALVVGDMPREVDVPYAIYGREQVSTMLPADEALVLVLMLTCNGISIEHAGAKVRGFSLVRVGS